MELTMSEDGAWVYHNPSTMSQKKYRYEPIQDSSMSEWYKKYFDERNNRVISCEIIKNNSNEYEIRNVSYEELRHLFIGNFSYMWSNIIKLRIYEKNKRYWFYYDKNIPTLEFYDEGHNYTQVWANKTKLHREDNKPAIISTDTKKYFYNDKLFRSDGGPQRIVIKDNIKHFYYYNNNENLIRMENEKGEYETYRPGGFGSVLHSYNDQPSKVTINGISKVKMWHKNGVLHRQNGPAWMDDSNNWCYYENGLKHRFDGPAEFMFGVYKNWIRYINHPVYESDRIKEYDKYVKRQRSSSRKNRDSKINSVLGI